ncbi:MAG: hypothetical protein L0Y54_20100 [Sporichthyaceae bacterium]|nr:hypothetical protein [Sporichthyaceae bacterium]
MPSRLRRSLSAALLVAGLLVIGNVSATAQPQRASEVLMSHQSDNQLFSYRRAPARITELSAEHRDGAVIRDITYTVAGSTPVRAYLVEPETGERQAAVLFLHWFHPGDPTSSRLEFVDEAVALAQQGVVGLLPDLTLPWNADPVGDKSDLDRVVEQTVQARRGLDLLHGLRGVDRNRVAVVGHDYGGMYGMLVASLDRQRVRTVIAINVDATFSNWFAQFWLGYEGADTIRYEQLLEPADPVRFVGRTAPGGILYQFSEPDFFIPDSTRRTLVSATADPKAYQLYPGAEHKLPDQAARQARIDWLNDRLDLD